MIADVKMAQLVRKLHENTQDKRITWASIPDHNAFEATFPRYTLRLSEDEIQDRTDYVVTIINDQGVAVDRFSDVDLSDAFPGGTDEGWFKLMREIYEMARRQALRADEAIDAILGELD
jgi:hypothetical protein